MIREYSFDFRPEDVTVGIETYRSTRLKELPNLFDPNPIIRRAVSQVIAALNDSIVALSDGNPEEIVSQLRNISDEVVEMDCSNIDLREAGLRLFSKFPQAPSLAMFLREKPGTNDVGEYIMAANERFH